MVRVANDSHSVQITCFTQTLVTQLSSTLPEHYTSGKSGPVCKEMFSAEERDVIFIFKWIQCRGAFVRFLLHDKVG